MTGVALATTQDYIGIDGWNIETVPPDFSMEEMLAGIVGPTVTVSNNDS